MEATAKLIDTLWHFADELKLPEFDPANAPIDAEADRLLEEEESEEEEALEEEEEEEVGGVVEKVDEDEEEDRRKKRRLDGP